MAVLRKGNPDRICLHHSASSPGAKDLQVLGEKLWGFERYHAGKSWAKTTQTPGEHGFEFLAYHRVIARNGFEITTQADKYVMYHAGDNFRGADSFNLHGIGVMIDGNYENEDYTPEQLEGFSRLIARFEKKYKVNVIVRGHKQTAKEPTACPGKNLGTHESGFMKKAIARANVILRDNLPTNPLQEDKVEDPTLELKKRINILTQEIEGLRIELRALGSKNTNIKAELEEAHQQLTLSEEKYGTLMIEKKTLSNSLADITQKYNQLKGSRFIWLVEWLEKVLPK